MLTIRNSTDKDIKDIEYICRMTAGPLSRSDEKLGRIISLTYSTYYAREEQETSFVLDDDGKVVGYLLCAPDFKFFSKGYRKNEVRELSKLKFSSSITAWFIPFVYMIFSKKYPAHLHIDLLEGYRGNGNGTKMIDTLLNKLKEMNIKGVMLIVDSENESGVNFYIKNGFHKIISAFGGTVMARELK